MNKRALYLLAPVFLSGCATLQPPTYTITAPFNQAQAQAMLADGSNRVEGTAVVRMQNGGARTCAGNVAELVPATAYARERMMVLYGNTERGINRRVLQFSPDLPPYHALTHRAACDADGRFVFENVADGEFFVIANVTWQVLDYTTEGGMLMQRVDLSGGEAARVVLAP